MASTDDTRTIVTRCDHCGTTDAFTTDNLTVIPGDECKQLCSRYPDCASRHATVMEAGA